LGELVRTRSVSGEEHAVAHKLLLWAQARGLTAALDDAGVRIEVAGRAPGPSLWLASHLDTVPLGEGWSRDPLAGTVENGTLHGRGASDAKASVAAMAVAASALHRAGGPVHGRLVVLATFGEETTNTTMPLAIERLGRPDAAIIGEPTSLEPCVSQRGLVILRLRWRGTAAHAGWAAAHPGAADNAIDKAAREIARLADLRYPREHPVLGWTAATVTRIEGGSASNVVPESCIATVDVRTTPAYTPDEVVDEIARAAPSAEVELVSRRFLPCETPPDSRLLSAILSARAGGRPFGSPTASDWVFLRDVDAVKLGPGDSRLSHTNEERISLAEVEQAVRLYADVAREYLS
jgi:acetylornithine deacetylase